MDLSKHLIMFFVHVYRPFNLVRNSSSNQPPLRVRDPIQSRSSVYFYIVKAMHTITTFSCALDCQLTVDYVSQYFGYANIVLSFLNILYFNDHFFAQYVISHFHL